LSDTPSRTGSRRHYAPETAPLVAFADAVPALHDGGDTPRAFLERCLETLASREPEVAAFVCLDTEKARSAADAAGERYRAGRPLSPIDGCPVGVKDIIETANFPTQMNSPIYEGWQSGRDAACVYALRQGGAVITGKTVTTEFATGASGPTRNPHDPERTPGGSSSGSAAAVGAGMLPVALGTQTAGSVVRPASFCGVYGFKPSHAALNIGGIHPLSNSHDTLGTLAGSLADAWITARHIAAVVGGTPPHPGLAGPAALPEPQRPAALVLLRTDGWKELDAATLAAFEAFLGRLAEAGVKILDAANSEPVAALENLLAGVGETARAITSYERRWPFLDYAERYPDKLSAEVRERVLAGADMPREDYRTAMERQEQIRRHVESLSEVAAGFVSLTASGPAPVGLDHTGSRSFQIFWTLTATPCVTLPLLAVDALPVGVQVMGFRDRDADLMSLAGWIDRLPRA
jgi:Asp-tRNA(Asn)/Glu-tRNA(Gln) amidotransferase A subunit family amidase